MMIVLITIVNTLAMQMAARHRLIGLDGCVGDDGKAASDAAAFFSGNMPCDSHAYAAIVFVPDGNGVVYLGLLQGNSNRSVVLYFKISRCLGCFLARLT